MAAAGAAGADMAAGAAGADTAAGATADGGKALPKRLLSL